VCSAPHSLQTYTVFGFAIPNHKDEKNNFKDSILKKKLKKYREWLRVEVTESQILKNLRTALYLRDKLLIN
jgi:hypothetical protein